MRPRRARPGSADRRRRGAASASRRRSPSARSDRPAYRSPVRREAPTPAVSPPRPRHCPDRKSCRPSELRPRRKQARQSPAHHRPSRRARPPTARRQAQSASIEPAVRTRRRYRDDLANAGCARGNRQHHQRREQGRLAAGHVETDAVDRPPCLAHRQARRGLHREIGRKARLMEGREFAPRRIPSPRPDRPAGAGAPPRPAARRPLRAAPLRRCASRGQRDRASRAGAPLPRSPARRTAAARPCAVSAAQARRGGRRRSVLLQTNRFTASSSRLGRRGSPTRPRP